MRHTISKPIAPIKVGIIGCGAMGRGLVYQSSITPEIDCVAVADLNINKCTSFLNSLNLPYQIANNLDQMHEIIKNGKIAVTEDSELIAQSESIVAVIEATNTVTAGAGYALMALSHNKHLVLMNSEIDLIFGPYLVQLAKEKGLICTSCDGDQYGVIKHLIDDLEFWGFQLVMAGNIKGFLDRYANPNSIIPEADKRNLDYKMCTSYTDGTKLNIEMSIIANAYGLITPIPGMHGPRATHVNEVLEKFDFHSLWKGHRPVVDYILGAEPGGGVYAVGYSSNSYQREMMRYYKMGDGPFYLFYRPYHLCHIEAMSSIIKAVHEKTALLQPNFGMQTNVYSYAKRDLKPGETLDGIGGYTCYGLIENCTVEAQTPGIPIGLAEDITVKRAIRKDEKILLSDVLYPRDRYDFALYNKTLELSKRYPACI